ncbi:unnamed protein product [Phaeothamnion confervicola]
MEEAKRQVARIREEFRKYRVRSELQAKQRDAEARLAAADTIAEKQRRIHGGAGGGAAGGGGGGGGIGGGGGGALALGKAQALEEEVQRLQAGLAEQDDMWRQAYEKQASPFVRETEQLKRAGNEAALAAQWRQRYEQCVREKEDAQAKLHMLMQGHSGRDGSGAGGGGGGGTSEALAAMMQKYADLKDEYRLYRKKAMAAIAGSSATPSPDGAPTADPKLQYLRNLMLKYLTTAEDDGSRAHMERALVTVLQFSANERRTLEDFREKRTAKDVLWLSGLFASQGAAAGGAASASSVGSGGGGGGRGLT